MRSVRQCITLRTPEEIVNRWNSVVEAMRHIDTELDLEFFGELISTYGAMRRRKIPVTSGLHELLAMLARDAFSIDDSDGTTKRSVRATPPGFSNEMGVRRGF
ncbi:MAG TPA: hypothetical protein PLD59_04620 [Tepidisphaeraceae bacterium]|nr:hypothetical protein [Tepidisphaeraceae bacterium]